MGRANGLLVVPLRRGMWGVGQFAGGGKPWDKLFASQSRRGESQPRHDSPTVPVPLTATDILLDRVAPPALGANLTSVRMAAISSWYSFIRRSNVRRSFVQTGAEPCCRPPLYFARIPSRSVLSRRRPAPRGCKIWGREA